MLLSACLIVKNEAHVLARCLGSLEGVVDEIVVVDTGSTDDTPRIAESFGARVYHFEWTGDFAAARNESLRHAQGDYVLVIDADEFLPKEDGIRLRQEIEKRRAEAYTVDVVNYLGSVARFVRSPGVRVVRVFRRGFSYIGSIHEQVLHEVIARGGQVEVLDVEIHHLGYLAEFVALKGKPDRNLEILNQVLSTDPDNFFHITNLMAEYARLGDSKKVVELGERAYALIRRGRVSEPHLVLRMYRMLMTAHGELEDYDRVEELAREAEQLFPNIPDVPFVHALYVMQQGDWRKAIQLFERSREIGDVRSEIIDTIAGAGSYAAATKLGELWLLEGDVELAREYFVQSLSENLRQEGAFFLLASLLPLKDPSVFAHLRTLASHDAVCLAHLALAGAISRVDHAWQLTSEIEQTPVTVPILFKLRALGVALGTLPVVDGQIDSSIEQEVYWYKALLALERGDLDKAKGVLRNHPERWQRLSAWLAGEQGLYICPILDELLLARADRLLLSWLPRAKDRDIALSRVLASPLREEIWEAQWRGDRGWEFDFLAMMAFRRRDIQTSLSWLERGLAHEPTVRRAIVEIDLALFHGNIAHAQDVARQASELFPESKLLKGIARNLGLRPRQIRQLDDLIQEVIGLNPHRAYQSSVSTMPLKVKIVKLHERAVECVDQVMALVNQGDVMGARTYIQYVQDIITFLRSNLDTSTEAGKSADAAYAYFYKMLVQWFLQPSRVENEYKDMRDFWCSWADTWAKVQA